MGRNSKKRKKKNGENGDMDVVSGDESTDFSSVKSLEMESDKYAIFKVPNYSRTYPENGGNFEYIVFLESSVSEQPIGNRDMMSLSNCIKRYNKGVKQLLRINKYKIGVIFERPGQANAALANKNFLEQYKFIASIPAAASEVTGVILHVPTNLSNAQIYSAISSSKNIVCVRRFMRKVNNDGRITEEPTKTVSITFSCPVLPDSVDLNSWRFELRPYIPPVKQCLRCLRYGHIAKFCKNELRCSICQDNHKFTECQIDPKSAKCVHCSGNHISISTTCPVKQQKINENKIEVEKKTQKFTDLFNSTKFPKLNSRPDNISSIISSDTVMNLLIEAVVKIISLNKGNEKPICNQSIKDILLETITKKKASK
ncbi:uncharacterized protein LOC134806013 [Cydia splendana]|uniref:uncharacterized protein LOC134799183 n=1 Tax=Cydia splendana TaxID=1100963 RepID=UPI00300C1282